MKGVFILLGVVSLTLISTTCALSRVLARPPATNDPLFARWLVNQSAWGVLNTLDALDGSPFGNVVSYTDAGIGTPYFYLSPKDPTGAFAMNNPISSFTTSEYVVNSCNKTNDPQSPICAKITLSGQLVGLDNKSSEGLFAKAALFADHPQLGGWPASHNFVFFKLTIKRIFLVNAYVPFKTVDVEAYFNANPKM